MSDILHVAADSKQLSDCPSFYLFVEVGHKAIGLFTEKDFTFGPSNYVLSIICFYKGK